MTLKVTNTGLVPGATVAQIYVGEDHPTLERPAYELKAFEKVLLAPGETRTVKVELDFRSFAFWSPKTKSWQANQGDFTIYAGDSSLHLPLQQHYTRQMSESEHR